MRKNNNKYGDKRQTQELTKDNMEYVTDPRKR